MEIFSKDGRVNFVDAKNNFAGFETDQVCCERARYLILSIPIKTILPHLGDDWDLEKSDLKIDLSDYFFDENQLVDVFKDQFFYEGGLVEFKLISEGKPDLYLVFYNVHNGYYGHTLEYGIMQKTGKVRV